MSVYIKRNCATVPFTSSGSWTILSPVEQRIKAKIEAVGTPLRDWDVKINRGVLTGCNDAFIINGIKRAELINCDPKSAEIIRPILRGRDIKRYGYEFADKYLIATAFGSHEYLEKDYPAIYNHLLQFKMQLENRGQCRYTSSGVPNLSAPYPGQHHWLELDNNPRQEYLNDFSKQKIIYPNMTKYLPFVLDNNGYLTNQKCFIITGEHCAYLCAFLNSSLFKYCYKESFPELLGGTRELSKVFFDLIRVKKTNDLSNATMNKYINQIQELRCVNEDTRAFELQLDSIIFDIYEIGEEERQIIGFNV